MAMIKYFVIAGIAGFLMVQGLQGLKTSFESEVQARVLLINDFSR